MDIDVIERRVAEHHDFINQHRDTFAWFQEHMPFLEWLKERHAEWSKDVEGAKHEADEQVFGQPPSIDNDVSRFPPPDSLETGDRPEGEEPEAAVQHGGEMHTDYEVSESAPMSSTSGTTQ